jgi:hypothetical protein
MIRVYVTKTRATRISDTVHFKHQYITNPTVSPESHVVAAAQQLATALQGNIPAGNETAEALKKVSDLFTKIAMAKSKVAKAKAQRNRVRATSVRMSDCVRGIEPCEWKGKGHRFQRVGLLGCFSLVKKRRERKE